MKNNPAVSQNGPRFPRNFAKLVQTPGNALRKIRSDPPRVRQILKVCLALTTAVCITLPAPLAAFYGENPFLLGTIAIYLFPIRTIGGQLFHSAIGLLGILSAIGYVNLALFIANCIQSDVSENIGVGRRIFLLVSLGIAAFGCGYVRSKMLRSYLGINFFMVVSMFALIRGINHSEYQFRNFFYPMAFGCCVSFIISLLVWPEDRKTILRACVLKALKESKDIMKASQQGLRLGVPVEITISKISGAEKALGACLEEANYEICFSRVEPEHVVPLHQCLSRLISNVRVFNAAMRRNNRTLRRYSVPPGSTPAVSEMDDNTELFRETIFSALSSAIEIMESMEKRVNDLVDGNPQTPIEHEKFAQVLVNFSRLMASELRHRAIQGYHDLELAAFTDQLNTTILDMLDVVKDMAETISVIEPAPRTRLILPRKLRSGKALKETLSQLNGPSDEISVSQARSMMAADEAYVMYLEATTKLDRVRIWLAARISSIQRSRHLKYAVKFTVAMCILATPAYIARWYIWFDNFRAQLAMISAMVAMETTRGMSFRTAGMKLIGAATGGLTAFLVVVVSQGHIGISMGLTIIVGLLVGCLVTNTKWQKTGTVTALAYNLVLGVGTIFRAHAPISAAFARRLLTLPVGLSVALIVHLTVFPYHSRSELVKGLCSSLDWLHHLLFAIEYSEEHPALQTRFDQLVQKASQRVAFAKSLMHATHYEFSISGHWPYERFERIADKISDIMDLIVGEVASDPVLAFHLQGARTCETLRTKLLASLCNDLLVISHSLSARLHMPRHSSVSVSVLGEYQVSLLNQVFESPQDAQNVRNYCDVGRLADLVSEMTLLRNEVDELTMETQCPKRGLLPHLSHVAKKSRPSTPVMGRGWDGMASTVIYDEEEGERHHAARDLEAGGGGDKQSVHIAFENDVRPTAPRGGHTRDVSHGSDSDDTIVEIPEGEEMRMRRGDDMV